MPVTVAQAEADVQVVREIIALFRKLADELRAKGLPVDDMIRDLEAQIAGVLAAAKKVEDLTAEDALLTKKREDLRRSIDELIAHAPPDLVDGMATTEYLHGAIEREANRRRRGKKGVGG